MGFANRKKQRVKVETLRNCVVTGFIKLPEITKDYVEVYWTRTQTIIELCKDSNGVILFIWLTAYETNKTIKQNKKRNAKYAFWIIRSSWHLTGVCEILKNDMKI